MRFHEFKQLLEFAPPAGNDEVSKLLGILNNPKSSENLKQKIKALFSKILQAPAPTPDPVQEPEQPISEATGVSLTPAQLDQIRKELSSNPSYKAFIDAIESQASREGVTLGVSLARDPDAVMGNVNEQIEDLLNKLPQIPNDVKTVVADACFGVFRKTKQIQPILDFLKDCAQPKRPIDLPGIIKGGGSGKLMEPNHPYYQIVSQLAKLNPGSGNSASGQGEWMLVLAGTDTKKMHPGDIAVGKMKVEIKASDTKEGKSGLTDFVLNSKKMPVAHARKILVDAINNTLGRKEVGTGRATEGGISALNDKTLIRLNPLFVEMNQKSKGSVQNTFRQMWQTVMPEPELAPYIDGIVKAIDKDGTVRLEKLYAPTAILAAAYYKASNKHDVLLLLNIPTLSYTAVEDPASIAGLLNKESTELTMSSIFDFRDNPGAITFKRIVASEIKKSGKKL